MLEKLSKIGSGHLTEDPHLERKSSFQLRVLHQDPGWLQA